jgi:hypothetical protein
MAVKQIPPLYVEHLQWLPQMLMDFAIFVMRGQKMLVLYIKKFPINIAVINVLKSSIELVELVPFAAERLKKLLEIF